MKLRTAWLSISAILVCTLIFGGCAANGTRSGPALTLKDLGTGTGKVTDNLSEANCADASGVVTGTCTPGYASGTMVTFTAAVTAPSTFAGWGGACASSGTATTCTVTVSSSQTVTADFIPPPAMQNVTFPAGTNPPAQQATFNCPSNTNPCTDPNAHSLQLQIPQVGTGFTITVLAVEVPPSQGIGLCKAGNTVLNDFDCRFATFFNYGTDGQGNITVPLCYPYANGNCVHYEVFSGTPGTEPDPTLYSGGVNWQIAWNNDTYTPPAPYTGNQPRLYDDPDYAPTPTSAVGSLCTQPMTINGVNQSYSCQFEFDITTSFNASQPVDSGIGGRTRQLNDVVVGFPPTITGTGQLSASTTPDSTTVPRGSPIGFTINVSNAGPGTDNGVTLSDPLPSGAGVTWSISPAYSGPGTCSITGTTGSQVLNCAFGNLAAGANAAVHVSSATAPAGTYTNAATITVNNQQYLTLTTITVSASAESIAFTPALPASATAGGTLSVNATVSNDPGNGGVDWTVTCGSVGACGSFTPTHTLSGASTTYNAPASVPAGNTVTITATATDAPSPQVSAVVTINIAPLIIQTSSLPGGVPNLAYAATITASGGLPPYTFSLDSGSTALPSGLTFNPGSPAATITGTPTALGTTNNIIVDVQDSEGIPMTAQKTYSITVATCGSGSESLLSGQYAYMLQGFDANGPVALIGSFTADGTGKITAGEEDLSNSTTGSTPPSLSIIPGSSSYSVGLDVNGGYRGCMTIGTSAAISTYRFGLSQISSNVANNGRMIEFDATGTLADGVMGLQNAAAFTNSQVSGNYTFGASSTESLTTQNRVAVAGTFSVSGTTISSGNVDTDENGNVDNHCTSTPCTFTGTRGSPDGNGRTTFTTLTNSTGSTPQDSVYYIVSASELLLMSNDSQSSNGIFAGTILQQSGGPFSNSSLSGNAVASLTGLSGGPPPASDVQVGLLSFPSLGNFTFNADENDGGTISTNSDSGTYSVASNGRVTVTTTVGGGGHDPVLYLVSPNKGFIVGTDNSVTTGTFEPQSPGPFSNASASGVFGFGTIWPAEQNVSYHEGWASFNGSGIFLAMEDDVSLSGQAASQTDSAQNYSVASNGRGIVFTNGNSGTPDSIFYIVSATKAISMDAYGGGGSSPETNPTIVVAEH